MNPNNGNGGGRGTNEDKNVTRESTVIVEDQGKPTGAYPLGFDHETDSVSQLPIEGPAQAVPARKLRNPVGSMPTVPQFNPSQQQPMPTLANRSPEGEDTRQPTDERTFETYRKGDHSRWRRSMGVAAVVLALALLALVIYVWSIATDAKNGLASVNARADQLQKEKADHLDLQSKVEQKDFDKLQETVRSVVASDTKQNAALKELGDRATQNEANITDLTNSKIDRKELKGLATISRVAKIEDKLEAHIAGKEETTPAPTGENQAATSTADLTLSVAAPMPTHNVRYRYKRVDINELQLKE